MISLTSWTRRDGFSARTQRRAYAGPFSLSRTNERIFGGETLPGVFPRRHRSPRRRPAALELTRIVADRCCIFPARCRQGFEVDDTYHLGRRRNHCARRGKPPGIGHLSGDGEELSDPLRRQCHKAAVIERRMDPTVGMVLAAAGPVNPGKAPYKFESSPLQRRVNELSVPLDEGVFEPPDLLQTRMNGCDQIVVEADQILRRPRAMSRPRARATEAKR